MRTDQHALLPLNEFILMFRAGWAFVVDCEVLCRKMIVGLRGTMVVQVRLCAARPVLVPVLNLLSRSFLGQDVFADIPLAATVQLGSTG